MKLSKLSKMNFMALCCIIGLFCKNLINPLTNVITDALHIPGGVSTGFAIMFIVIAAELVQEKKSATIMSSAQGLLALMLGRVGSMGMLMPIGYFVPGVVIDIVFYFTRNTTMQERLVFANALGAVSASLTANILVFQLSGPVLILYLSISALSGACYGFLATMLTHRLIQILHCRRISYEIE